MEGDGLPVNICFKCLNSVTAAFSFKLQVEKADAKLKNYIAAEKVNPSQTNFINEVSLSILKLIIGNSARLKLIILSYYINRTTISPWNYAKLFKKHIRYGVIFFITTLSLILLFHLF